MMNNRNKLIKIYLSTFIVVALFLQSGLADMGMMAGSPSISISSPKEGAMIAEGNVTIEVNVTNFNLVNKLGKPNVAGEGHIHYYMDVPVPRTPGKPAVTAVGTFAPSANTSFTWKNVKLGTHNFSIQLANNDHTPLIPLVYSTVNATAVSSNLHKMSVDNVTINLVAKNIAFNATKITVPAGANVTINFDNEDAGVAHNVAFYNDASAKKQIYVGEIFQGPKTIVYRFKAPDQPGTYFFRCDVHPTAMKGEFIVT